MEFWNWIGALEESQAELLTTCVLVIGGAVGIWLGSKLYGKRVTDLKGAVEETEATITEYRAATEAQLSELKGQLDAAIEQLSRARREITKLAPEDDEDEIESVQTGVADETATPPSLEPAGDRQNFKQYWYAIRDKLRETANNPNIHGLRRNKYNKYTNYQIGVLIDDMFNDDVISHEVADLFHEAHDLFVWHRNGRPFMSSEDVSRMAELASALGAFKR